MKLQNLVHQLRLFRSWHKWMGLGIMLFILITAFSGVLLGWKKNLNILQPPTLRGNSLDVREWVSMEVIAQSAHRAMDSITHRANEIDRMDVRFDKGIIKVLFTKGYWEVQVDASTGKVFSVAQRHADWIEHIHDGSIIGEVFKVAYTNYTGWSLMIMTLTGFLLWYGPRLIRQFKRGTHL